MADNVFTIEIPFIGRVECNNMNCPQYKDGISRQCYMIHYYDSATINPTLDHKCPHLKVFRNK